MVLLREDDPKLRPLPIFGNIFTNQSLYSHLEMMPIRRHFKIKSPRPWLSETADKENRRVFELATLPNDQKIESYANPVMDIIRDPMPGKASKLMDLLNQADFRKFASAFEPHRKELKRLVEFSNEKPYLLSVALEKMLRDRGTGGKDSVNLEEFWNNSEPKVQSLLNDVKKLIDQVRYLDGSPFVLANTFGKGKVLTVMTTAGNYWQDWAGGTASTVVYQPFIWEMQNYLSAQGADINLKLGERYETKIGMDSLGQRVDPKRTFDPKRYEMYRYLLKELQGKEAVPFDDKGNPGKGKGMPGSEKDKTLIYSYPTARVPGVYMVELFEEEAERKSEASGSKDGVAPIFTTATVYNVDTVQEGNLERVDHDIIKDRILDKGDKRITFAGDPSELEMLWKPSHRDLSEMPLMFLLFLTILIAEQALAVHLSYHLRGAETFVPAGQQQPQQPLAA